MPPLQGANLHYSKQSSHYTSQGTIEHSIDGMSHIVPLQKDNSLDGLQESLTRARTTPVGFTMTAQPGRRMALMLPLLGTLIPCLILKIRLSRPSQVGTSPDFSLLNDMVGSDQPTTSPRYSTSLGGDTGLTSSRRSHM